MKQCLDTDVQVIRGHKIINHSKILNEHTTVLTKALEDPRFHVIILRGGNASFLAFRALLSI